MMRSHDAGEAGTNFFYVKGQRVPLERDPEVFAVRLRTGVRDDSEVLSPAARRVLREESEPVTLIPNYGLRIRRRTDGAAQSQGIAEGGNAQPDQIDAIRRLDEEPAVDLAVAAFRRVPGSEELMFTTRRFVVQFRPEVGRSQVDALNAEHGVTILEPATYMINGFVLQAPNGEGPTGPVALANRYFETGLALSATPDFVRQMHFKHAVPTKERAAERVDRAAVSERGGEFLDRQWHLPLAKVTDAWNVTIGDPSIVVAILDDGIDVDHAEFVGKVVGQSDFAAHVSDARPKSPSDKHGTACAGVAVATGVKAHGSAPGCSLLAVRTPEFLGVADEAEMFRWVTDQGADVISCSWGPADGTGQTDLLPDNVREAIRYSVTSGRGGKGIPIAWAAGNGDESVSLDGYASNPDVMAIGASTNRETRAWYSDFGPEVWVCAPSSGSTAAGERRVFTTDRRGSAGYNTGIASAGDAAGDYTNDFGGTSSATPLVAGVAGLMLSVNPSLTHRQVRDILRTTAERIGDPGGYDASGHSPHFGFGRIDAKRAVDAARAGGGGGTVPAGRPTIAGPTEVRRSDGAPTFTVGTLSNPLFAVEVAIRWQLFDGSHDDERTADAFYGSWQEGLISGSMWTIPAAVWERMRATDRLYYRVHSARDSAWTDWQTSLPDEEAASAPSIEIRSGAAEGPIPEPVGGRPTIAGPDTISRDEGPPEFRISLAGNPLYAVEVATRRELFDGSHDEERTDDTFYGSWQDENLFDTTPYQLSPTAWDRLRNADRLFYRLHTAQDAQWNGWETSLPDAEAMNAPEIVIAGGSGGGFGGGGGGGAGGRTVRYPMTSFPEATSPDDGIDYSDRVAGGSVPLIEVRNRLEDQLSANFKVRELAARRLDRPTEKAAYARISPELVEGLQSIREAVGGAVTIVSGYRYPALNEDVDGAGQSQHMAGRAADIKSSAKQPLDLARIALDVLGRDIGLGLGRTSLHVDVRGEPASWVYAGAPLSEADFDAWVRRTATELGRSVTLRLDAAERMRPAIIGPDSAIPGSAAPSFSIEPAGFPFYCVEIADDPRLLAAEAEFRREELPGTFASWRDGGMLPSGDSAIVTYSLPDEAWERLGRSGRLYYRVVCSSTPDLLSDTVASVPTDRLDEFPSFQVNGMAVRRTVGEPAEVDPAAARREDEARWRDERTAPAAPAAPAAPTPPAAPAARSGGRRASKSAG
jgi:subtilisin family serine protease